MDKKDVDALKISTYPGCNHIDEHKIDVEISEDQMEKFSHNYRVFPLLEQQMQDFVCQRRTSFRCNELLRCRWRERVSNIGFYLEKKRMFRFPRQCDFHFHNYHNQYLPDQSTDNSLNHRRQMRMGPGEDQLGQLPIPADLHTVARTPGSWKCKEKHAKKDCTRKKFARKETGAEKIQCDQSDEFVTIFRRDAICPSSSTSSVDLFRGQPDLKKNCETPLT